MTLSDTVPIESIIVTAKNGDEVADFLGATTYTLIRSRLMTPPDYLLSDEFTTTGYMMSIPDSRVIRVDVDKVLIKPSYQYSNALFVGPQTGD